MNSMPVATAENKLAAMQAYNKLTPEQQAKVSPVIKAAIGVANSDETAVAEVINLVNALKADSTKDAVLAALKAYVALTDKQEALALTYFTDEAKQNLGL